MLTRFTPASLLPVIVSFFENCSFFWSICFSLSRVPWHWRWGNKITLVKNVLRASKRFGIVKNHSPFALFFWYIELWLYRHCSCYQSVSRSLELIFVIFFSKCLFRFHFDNIKHVCWMQTKATKIKFHQNPDNSHAVNYHRIAIERLFAHLISMVALNRKSIFS